MAVRVLFVCLGNICRSPMAEAVFQHLVDEAGLSDEISVDSAGTGSWHIGERAHPGTRRVLAQHGIAHEGRARQIAPEDFSQFGYILAMDNSNLTDLRRLMPPDCTATLRRFLDFADGASSQDVPDPYYDGRFEEVYALVRQGAAGLLAHQRREHGL